jgi:hypothetical protein
MTGFSGCSHTFWGTGGHGGVSCGAPEDTELEPLAGRESRERVNTRIGIRLVPAKALCRVASHSCRLVLFRSMTPEEIEDAVLAILSAGTPPLTAEEICSKMQPSPAIRDVRVALRELSSAGEVLKDTSQRWSAVARAAEPHYPPRHDFTDAELKRARQRFGTMSKCPNCGKQGEIDRLFGWRRMHPDDPDLQPQSHCITCRAESSRRGR